MKSKLFLKFFFLFIFILCFSSCEKDEGSSSSTNIVFLSGTWKITEYTINGAIDTTSFKGYQFIFFNNETVKANKNGSSSTGTWKSLKGLNQNFINIDFANTPLLLKLNADWTVLEKTSTKLCLNDSLSGNNENKLVTFVIK